MTTSPSSSSAGPAAALAAGSAQVWTLGRGRLVLRQGDITQAPAQAVVNAANARLAGGGGVDGAIHRAAGHDQLQAACREIIARRGGPLRDGEAEITPGFDLPARWIIHAVGPIWRGGSNGEPQALAAAYRNCLRLAGQAGAESIAFPAISCGVYGYPVELAAPLALGVVAEHLRSGQAPGLAAFYLFSAPALAQWRVAAEAAFGAPDLGDS